MLFLVVKLITTKTVDFKISNVKSALKVDNAVDVENTINDEQNYHFDRTLKLLNAEHFKNVFSKSQRFGNKSFTVLARENNLGHSRLGLAISKKCAKRAVDRNRIKRIFRESFRLHQHTLPNVDIIAMCKSSVLQLDKQEMHSQIETQWRFMQKKFINSTTSDQSS